MNNAKEATPRRTVQLKGMFPFFGFSIGVHALAILVIGYWLCPWLERIHPSSRAVVDVDVFELGKKGTGGAKGGSKSETVTPKPAAQAADSSSTMLVSDGVKSEPAHASDNTSPEAEQQAVTISGGDGGDLVLSIREYLKWVSQHNEAPIYPRLANQRGETGTVIIRAVIAKRGSPPVSLEMEKSSGFSLLDRVALEAVEGWRFPPFKANAETITFPLVFKFGLD